MTQQASYLVRRICTYVTLAFLVLTGVVAFLVNHPLADRLEPLTEMDVAVVGYDYLLHFRYPGNDRVLYTDDDRYGTRNLYAPNGTRIRLRMSSRDFVYTIEVPEIELYEVAVPELEFESNFVVPHFGSHKLMGSQMCGYDHPELIGEFVSQSFSDFRRTMDRLSPNPILTQ